jgi:hypothetical protein
LCVETRNIEVFGCCLSHFRNSSDIIYEFLTTLREFLDPGVDRFTRQTLLTLNRKHFFMNILSIETFCPQRTLKRTLIFGGTFSSTVAILTIETRL